MHFFINTTLCIADMGCSIGPNTFIAMQNIVEAIKLKYRSEGLSYQIPEFRVFFNDLVSNDFNKLFASLPIDRQYFAAGVPGSFRGRLFLEASLHLVHSSSALHWLSKVPKEVLDKDSPAWNKGKIYYESSPKEVVEAYSTQFGEDMESFLLARAEELVPGGLMILIMLGCLSNEIPYSKTFFGAVFDLLASSLMDMAKIALISEAKVDSFNVPAYNPHILELEGLLTRDYFSIEGMELVNVDLLAGDVEPSAQMTSMHIRAATEGLIKEHFGSDIIDELFDRFTVKIAEDTFFLNVGYKNLIQLFVILKRMSD